MRSRKVTIRFIMAAVTIAAIPLAYWSWTLNSTRLSYLESAVYHSQQEAKEIRNIAALAHSGYSRAAALSAEASRLRVAYHAELKQKYQLAASQPWREVESDGPDPGEKILWRLMEVESHEFPMITAEMMEKLRTDN